MLMVLVGWAQVLAALVLVATIVFLIWMFRWDGNSGHRDD